MRPRGARAESSWRGWAAWLAREGLRAGALGLGAPPRGFEAAPAASWGCLGSRPICGVSGRCTPSDTIRRLVRACAGDWDDWDRARRALNAAQGDVVRAVVAVERQRARSDPLIEAECSADPDRGPKVGEQRRAHQRLDRTSRILSGR